MTGVDVMDATPAFRAQHAHQRSAVRFVRGDVNDPGLLEAVGVHDEPMQRRTAGTATSSSPTRGSSGRG